MIAVTESDESDRTPETSTTYRNALIERSRQYQLQSDEPAVLDYLQLRNRQCLYAWHLRRMKHELEAQVSPLTASAEHRNTTHN